MPKKYSSFLAKIGNGLIASLFYSLRFFLLSLPLFSLDADYLWQQKGKWTWVSKKYKFLLTPQCSFRTKGYHLLPNKRLLRTFRWYHAHFISYRGYWIEIKWKWHNSWVELCLVIFWSSLEEILCPWHEPPWLLFEKYLNPKINT